MASGAAGRGGGQRCGDGARAGGADCGLARRTRRAWWSWHGEPDLRHVAARLSQGCRFLAQLTKPDVAVWVKRVKRCVGVSGWSLGCALRPYAVQPFQREPARSRRKPVRRRGAQGGNPSRAVAVCYRDAARVLHSPTLIDMGIIRRVVFGLGRAHSPQLPARVAMVS